MKPSFSSFALLGLFLIVGCDSATPAKSEPGKTDVGKTEVAKTDAKADVAKAEPTAPSDAKVEPTAPSDAKVEPTIAEPAKAEPAPPESVKAEPPAAPPIATNTAEADADIKAALTKVKTLADDMCACKDKACADKVTTELTSWGEAMAKKYVGKQEPEPNEAQKKELEAHATRLGECMMKVMAG